MELAKAESLCKDLMRKHGVGHFAFEWMRSGRTFGRCRYLGNGGNGGIILLSRTLVALNNEEHVLDTILHEIAHAKVGPGHAHGPIWKRMARLLGAHPERSFGKDVVAPPRRPYVWASICKSHGVVGRARVRRSLACKRCCRDHNNGRFHPSFLLEWRRLTDTTPAALPPTLHAPGPVGLTPAKKAWITRRARAAALAEAAHKA